MRQPPWCSIHHLLARHRQGDVARALAECSPTHLAYLDGEFRFVFVNDAYVKGSGHSREELLGRNHFEVFPNTENEAIFRRVRDSGQPACFVAKPFEYADQPWRGVTYWDWTLTPVKDRAGRVKGLAFSLTDVTSRVQADGRSELHNARAKSLNARLVRRRRQAERQAEQLRVLMESLAEGVAVFDRRGRITYINPAAAGLLSVPRPNQPRVVGELSLKVSVGEQALPLSRALMMRTFVGRETATGEVSVTGPDGTPRQLSFTRALVRSRAGKVTGAVVTFHDVSELRRLERAKDDFLQVLAHELRNPLAAAHGLVSLARQRLKPENLAGVGEQLALTSAQLDRLNALIGEIIDGYRVSSGRLPLDLGPVDLNLVVAQTVAPHQKAARGADLVVGEPPARVLPVRADAGRLAQVLDNLLANAFKYSPPGSEIRMTMATEAGPAGVASDASAPAAGGASWVVLRVEDEGIGIPPDQLEKVFEGFYRASNITSSQPGGLGLGLYVSRDIIRRHGGELWAQNRPGGGTAMCLRLPLRPTPPPGPSS